MIPLTPDALEALAFDTGATITISGGRAWLTTGGVTYGALLEAAREEAATQAPADRHEVAL